MGPELLFIDSRVWMDPLEVLQERFKQKEFRTCQREIVEAALNGADILVLLPTGYGKSLTFQVPAVMTIGWTLVISPLLALIQNQVDTLQQLGIPTATINGTMTYSERQAALDLTAKPDPSILYVAPEQVNTTEFSRWILTHRPSRIVVDEAHCAVEWGRDFRPDYARLGDLRKRIPGVPMTALTGTASPAMRDQILKVLRLPSETTNVFTTSMARPNIHYEVRYVEDPDERLANMIRFLRTYRARIAHVYGPPKKPYPGCGIVYCRQRATTEKIAARLRQAGIGAQPFHAGLDIPVKTAVLNRWIEGDPHCCVVVATVAFGMGVDKPSTRFVIHYEMPANIEAFAQQSGRAGRDRKASRSILYYSMRDRSVCARFSGDNPNERESLKALLKLAVSTDKCRHELLNEYFDPEAISNCEFACDYCKNAKRTQQRYDDWLYSIS